MYLLRKYCSNNIFSGYTERDVNSGHHRRLQTEPSYSLLTSKPAGYPGNRQCTLRRCIVGQIANSNSVSNFGHINTLELVAFG